MLWLLKTMSTSTKFQLAEGPFLWTCHRLEGAAEKAYPGAAPLRQGDRPPAQGVKETAAPHDHLVQGVAGEGVVQGAAGDVLDRGALRQGQGQPGVESWTRMSPGPPISVSLPPPPRS